MSSLNNILPKTLRHLCDDMLVKLAKETNHISNLKDMLMAKKKFERYVQYLMELEALREADPFQICPRVRSGKFLTSRQIEASPLKVQIVLVMILLRNS